MRSHALRRLLPACLLLACLVIATPSVAFAAPSGEAGASTVTRLIHWLGDWLASPTPQLSNGTSTTTPPEPPPGPAVGQQIDPNG
jgi:hypothetical protein